MHGEWAESFANTLLGYWYNNSPILETIRIGGNWPTIDVYAEFLSSTNEKMFCFFQIKSTLRGFTSRAPRKLKVKISKRDLNRLANYSAPTFLIGVNFNSTTPQLSDCYIKTVRGNFTKGWGNIVTTYPLNQSNLLLLKNEVENFWTSLSPLTNKANYTSNF